MSQQCVRLAKKATPTVSCDQHCDEHCQQLEGAPVPLLSPSEATFGVLGPVPGPSVQDRLEQVQGKNTKMMRLEHLIYEERLKEFICSAT